MIHLYVNELLNGKDPWEDPKRVVWGSKNQPSPKFDLANGCLHKDSP